MSIVESVRTNFVERSLIATREHIQLPQIEGQRIDSSSALDRQRRIAVDRRSGIGKIDRNRVVDYVNSGTSRHVRLGESRSGDEQRSE